MVDLSKRHSADAGGPEADPGSVDWVGLTRRRAERDGPRPYLTFYDGDTGERTELSFATFGNWAAKTANLLVDECALGSGDRVLVALDGHWTGVAVLQACLWLAAVVDRTRTAAGDRETTGELAAAFVHEDLIDGLAAVVPPEHTYVVGSGFTGRCTRPVPYAEFVPEVLACADEYDEALEPADPSAPATVAHGERTWARGAMLAAAGRFADEFLRGGRMLRTLPTERPEAMAADLGAMSAGASVVAVRRLPPADLWRMCRDERVTALLIDEADLSALDAPGQAVTETLSRVAVPAAGDEALRRRAQDRLGVEVVSLSLVP